MQGGGGGGQAINSFSADVRPADARAYVRQAA